MENEFDKIEQLLYSEAKKIKPTAESLRSVLNKINTPVTKKSDTRLTNMGANKGQALTNNLFEHIKNIMNSFWKVAVPVGLAVVVIAAIGYWRFSVAPLNQPTVQKQAATQNVIAPTEFASAEVAQSVDEIINETIDTEAIADAEAEDASMGDYDAEALMAFDSVTTLYE
ncbi:MAG: hypothetical protein NTW66_00645 [Candidatus Magasanikbacteria bacterium]|nr:hypothetical protein [Candidatus Magasanikbacteria bacterium]